MTTVADGRHAGRLARLRIAVPRGILLAALPVLLFCLLAVIGPLVVSYDHVHTELLERLKPPGTQLAGRIAVFGTDQVGRDVFLQVLYGARVSLLVGFVTVLIAGVAGSTLGILAGVAGGRTDTVIMRAADIQLALPAFLLAILAASVIGPSVTNVIITLAVTRWVIFARVGRGAALAVRDREFVDSARILGGSPLRVTLVHIVPSCLAPLLVVATSSFGLVILAEASLSFLGLGAPATVPSWGQTIANGRDLLGTAWWISTLPGFVLAVVTVSFGIFGDSLRDVLDPRALAR